MSTEYVGYRDIEERVDEFRAEIVARMVRPDDWRPRGLGDRINLAAERGSLVRVDSFLATKNTANVDDVYVKVMDGRVEAGAIPFTVEPADHSALAALRERFDLVRVAGDGDDLTRAIRVQDWIKSLFSHRVPWRMPEWNALVILDRGRRGVENFLCIHYSVSLVQCCLALGIQARMINLHRGIADTFEIDDAAWVDPPLDEHVVAEVWSTELGKWVMLDVDFDVHYQSGDTPLSAWEIHQAFVDGQLSSLTCRRGPHSTAFTAWGDALAEAEFFSLTLPAYYAHVSVLMRNNFFSDPDGPVTVAHLVDEATEPILWHGGSDLRLQPHLMGPVVVAQSYRDTVKVLTDGNRRTGWASDDSSAEHWVEIRLAGPRSIGRIALTWPEYATLYRTSTRFSLEAEVDGTWQTLADVEREIEAPFTVHDVGPVTASAVRLRQPAGGGSREHPDRLWLNQIEILGPTG